MSWPPAAVCCSGWVAGVAIGVVAGPANPGWGALALVAGAALLAVAIAVRPVLIPLTLAALLLGLARADLPGADPADQARAAAAAGSDAVIAGLVADDARPIPGGFEVRVIPSSVATARGRLGPLGSLLVRVRGEDEVGIGDEVSVSGRLRLPLDRPDFDRRAYLSQQQVYLEVVSARLNVVRRAGGLAALPGWVRARYREALGQLLPAPHAAVLMGVVLGIRSGVPPRLEQDLIATGLVHLLVLSGLKVAIFARLALGALRPLLGPLATLPVMVLVALYALTGGATPAAIRSAAMGGLAIWASHLGRPSHVWTSLALAGAAMLAWRPELAWDVGFQLSFAGTAAIIVLTPPIERRLRWLPSWLREPFAVTCAAQVGTVPLMATDFHLISPIAPVANALVLPALPALVAAGLLIAPLALVPDVGRVAALPLVGVLAYLEQVAALLARVPGGALAVARFPTVTGAAYYSGIGGVMLWLRGAGRVKVIGVVLAVVGPLLLGGGELLMWDRASPSAAVLAVGDGAAVLLHGPDGYVLVDGGPSPSRLADELGQRLPPWRRRLEALVVTAPGLGHAGGLQGLGYAAGVVVLPAVPMAGTAWRNAVEEQAARGAALHQVRAGDRLRLAGLDIEMLAPLTGDDGGMAFRVTGPSGRSFCEVGELDLDSQAALAAHLGSGCESLLLPNGGKSAPAPELLAAARPHQLIASRGPGRLARGLPATVLRTDQEGDIEVPL